jgi:hypothetical protein
MAFRQNRGIAAFAQYGACLRAISLYIGEAYSVDARRERAFLESRDKACDVKEYGCHANVVD